MSSGKVKCTCGWSWNKSDSSKKDVYVCHECGRDNSNNIPKAQVGKKVVAESTGVYKKPFNERELKNIIKDDVEYRRTGDVKKPRAEANKFEKFLPDKKTVNFFKKMKKEAGPAIFREALKIQHERGNPSINVGTNKGLPFAKKKNYNPFTNEVNIPADIPGAYENQIYNYLEEVSHSGQPISEVIPSFLTNDIPGYVRAYASEGDIDDNINKYVYDNPNAVENYTHSKIQPELEQRINSAYSWPMSKEEESDFLEYTRQSLNTPKQKNGGWLDNYNDSQASAPEGMVGDGFSNVGRNYSPAWGGQFQNGGPIKPSQKDYKTKGEYNAALKSYNLNLHKYELANNPEKIKGESDKDYENRTKYFDFKIRQEEDKYPVSKAYLEMKDDQNSDPNDITRTLRQIATSPAHVAYGIYNAANPHDLDKYKSRATKNNEDLDLTNSSLDAASLLVPFDYGMKASPLWKQAAKRTAKEVAEDEGFNLLKAGNKWVNSFQMGGSVYPVNYVPEAQEGKKLTFLQPTSDKLPEGYRIPYSDPSSERAMSIGGENGEPAYLIPSFKYGKPLDDPMEEFRKTGEHLGGPFKTWQEADKWENETRHPAVEKGENIMFPQEQFAMGGSIPGAVGFSYARTQGAAPSKGPHRNKVDVTDASAQNGKEMQYYQNGLDFKPKSISKNGSWLSKYEGEAIKDDRGQWDHPGEITEINSNDITMEGVPYPVLGISDTGHTQMMYPGNHYKFKGKKVTEYPMAQNGKKVSGGLGVEDWWNNRKEIQSTYRMANNVDPFMKNWMNNSITKKRLNDQIGYLMDDNKKPINVINENLNTLPVYDQKKMEGKKTSDFISNYKLQNNLGSEYPDSQFEIFFNNLRKEPYVAGSYVPNIHSMSVKDINDKGTLAHEMAHGSGIQDKMEHYMEFNYNQKPDPNYPEDSYKKDSYDYLKKDGMYPRIMDIRRELNLKPGQKVDKRIFNGNNLQTDSAIEDLREMYDDNEIIKILNTIADNSKSKKLSTAKNGLRQEQKGLVNLDQLTNFTNYNKPTKGWLNKYN